MFHGVLRFLQKFNTRFYRKKSQLQETCSFEIKIQNYRKPVVRCFLRFFQLELFAQAVNLIIFSSSCCSTYSELLHNRTNPLIWCPHIEISRLKNEPKTKKIIFVLSSFSARFLLPHIRISNFIGEDEIRMLFLLIFK